MPKIQPAQPIAYNPDRHVYLKPNGKVATQIEVNQFKENEVTKTRHKFRALARRQTTGRLTPTEWEQEMRRLLREAHYRVAAIASGGEENLTPLIRWQLEGMLTQEYSYLYKFKNKLEGDEPFSAVERASRAMQYAGALQVSFSRVELAVRISEGGWEGWRKMEPRSDYCPDCPGYRTHGFVDVAEIVAIGWECVCRNNCNCQIVFRRKR